MREAIIQYEARGAAVRALLVQPEIELDIRCPAVVYAHGGGQDMNAFREEAVRIAGSGAIVLLPDLPVARAVPEIRAPEVQIAMYERTVAAIRGAYDWLTGRRDVDPARMGFVGVSFGAWMGIVMARQEARPVAFAFTAPPPAFTKFLASTEIPHFRALRDTESREVFDRFVATTAAFDALPQASSSRSNRGVLVQAGRRDPVGSVSDMTALARALGAEVGLQWYDADHGGMLTDPIVARDRIRFITEYLSPRRNGG